MTRRILALLLSVMMILSLAPSAVFADDSGDAADGEPITVTTEEPAEEPAEEAEEEPVLEPITDPLDDPLKPVDDVMGRNDVASVEYADGEGNEQYSTLAAAIAAAGTEVDGYLLGTTIELTKNVSENITIPAGKDITLDLNGKTLSNATGSHTVTVNGKLTVKDSGNGLIKSTNNCGVCVAGGTLIVESGSIEAQEMAILFIDRAAATINGGTFTAHDNAVLGSNGSSGRGGNTINVKGGTFNGTIQTAGYVACGIYAANNDVWNIEGGTFNITNGAGIVARAGQINLSGDVVINTTGNATGKVGDSRVVVPCAAIVFDAEANYPGLDSSAKLAVNGGTFTSEVNPVVAVGENYIEITDGKFSAKPEDKYFADGLTASSEATDGFYTVVTDTRVAKIGDVRYATLADALAAAQDGDVVEMFADATVTESIELSGKKITLDFAGHNVTSDVDEPIRIAADGDLTIKDSVGNGSLTTTNSTALSNAGKLTVDSGLISGSGIIVYNEGTMTMFGGKITDTGDSNVCGIWNHGGSLALSDGEVNISGKDAVAILATHGGSIEMTGGKIVVSGNEAAGIQVGYGESAATPATSISVTGGTIATEGSDVTAAIMAYSGAGTVEVGGDAVISSEADGSYALYVNGNANIAVDGGTINGAVVKEENATGAMTTEGGTFSVDVSEYCPDGYICVKDGEKYIVKKGKFVAQVGETKYETFAEAAAAANGETIILLADADAAYTLESGEMKVQLNGHSLTVNAPEGSVLKTTEADGVTTYTVSEAVAKINDTLYATLTEALADAQSGDTVELIAAVVELKSTDVIPAGVTIKGNGVDNTTLEYSGTSAYSIKKENVTIKDLTLDYNGSNETGRTMFSVNVANATFENIRVVVSAIKNRQVSLFQVSGKSADGIILFKNIEVPNDKGWVFKALVIYGTSTIKIQNSKLDALYPFNCDGSNCDVVVTDSEFHGWTSWNNGDGHLVSFTNVVFTKGNSGYNIVKPWKDCSFTDCRFIAPYSYDIMFDVVNNADLTVKDSYAVAADGTETLITQANILDYCDEDDLQNSTESVIKANVGAVHGESYIDLEPCVNKAAEDDFADYVFYIDPTEFLPAGYAAYQDETTKTWVVYKLVTGITVAPEELIFAKGDTTTQTLTATIVPDDALNTELVWTSSDETVATVDANGVVTPVGQGTATITVALKAQPDMKAEATVKVCVAKIGETLYASVEEAFAAAVDGDTIEMIADAEIKNSIAFADKKVTFDLKGKNVTSSADDTIHVLAGGELVFMDSVGTGSMTTHNNTALNNEGTLTVESGAIKTMDGHGGPTIYNAGTLTVNDGSITAEGNYLNALNADGEGSKTVINGGTITMTGNDGAAVIATGNATIEIKGGTIVADGNETAALQIGFSDSGNINVTGGTVKAQGEGQVALVMVYGDGKVSVSGEARFDNVSTNEESGLFMQLSGNGTLEVTGGYFIDDPTDYVDLSKYLVIKTTLEDGREWYTIDSAVAVVKEIGYPSVAEAKEHRDTNNDVITLLKNADYAFVAGDVLKIYKANDTIEFTYTVPETYVLTISDPDDNGVVTYTVVGSVAKIEREGETLYFASLADAVAAAVEGDTITMIADSTEANQSINIANKNFTLDLNGKVVTLPAGDGFTGSNATVVFMDSSDTEKNGTGTGKLAHTGAYDIADVTNATFTVESGTYEAGKYGVFYLRGNSNLTVNGGNLSTNGTGLNGLGNSTITINGGSVYGSNTGINVQGTAKMIINGGEVSGLYGIGMFDTAEVVMNDGTIKATGYCVSSNFHSDKGFTFTMKGGQLLQTDKDQPAIYMPGIGTVNIEGGYIEGKYAVKMMHGVLNISGGTLVGLSENAVEINSRCWGANDLRSDADRANYSQTPEVSITGGYFIGGEGYDAIEVNQGTNTHQTTGETVVGGIVEHFISDGHYSTEPASKYIVRGKAAYQVNEDGTIWWVIGDAVAEIGEVGYVTLEAAFAAAVDGDTIKVLKDCAGNGIKVPEGKFATGLTVDFAGFTYDFSGKGVGSTGTEYNGFQLLKNNTITFRNGTIKATSEDAGFLIQNYSNLTLDGMTIDGTGVWGGYVLSNNNGNVVIKDTTITAKDGDFAFDVCRYANYPSVSVTVTGSSVINGNIEISASGSDAKDGFSLMLESGTFNGAIVLDDTAKAAMAATPEKAWIKKVDANVADDGVGIPKDYKWVEEGEGKSRLTPKDYVAENVTTGEKYETLEEAVAEAKDGETVKLLKDCAGNGIKVPQGKFTTGLTVDFDGHTYTMDGAMVGSTGTETQAFQLLKDNNITFKNGTITSEKAKILVQNYSNLTLDGMTLTLDNASYANAYTLSNNNGNITIKDTTINANPAGGFAFDVCRYASYPSVSVTVTGSSVIKGNIEVSASGNDAKDGFSLMLESGTFNGAIVLDDTAKAAMAATPEKAWIKKVDANVADDGVGIPKDYKWVEEGEGKSRLTPKDYVAENVTTGEKYETLEEAVAEAKDGETVKLLKDCAGNGIKVPEGKFATGLTVDFAGFTYDFSGKCVGSTGTEYNGFQLLKNNTITFRNGTIKATSEDAGFLIQNYSNLTLDGMTIDGTGVWGGYVLSNNNGNVVIKDTTITAKDGDFAFDVCRYASYPSVSVTVTGSSKITGNIEISASGNDAKDGLSLMLEDGTFSGEIKLASSGADVIETNPEKAFVKKTNANVDDEAIGIPEGYMWRNNNDGTSTLVPAVVVTFVTEAGIEAPAAQTIEKGTKAEKPADPVKEHYNFLGWFAEGADEAFDFNTAITESITLTAKFEGEPITILYVNEDGTILQKFVVHYNDTVDAYTFTAFDDIVVPQGYKYYDDERMWTETVKSPATEDAVYVLNLVEGLTVTFNPDNGEDTWQEDVDAKDKVARPATDPIREGYFFMGWYNGNNVYDFNTPVTASITLTAKWEAYEYEITYVWAEDLSTVTATAHCTNAADYGVEVPDVTEKVNTTNALTKDPTGDENGEITYTAEFTNELFETQTKVVKTAKLPKAKVEEIESKENVKLYTMPGMNETTNVVDKIEAEYLFTALPADADTLETYGDWNCDYRITFDSRITKETFGLYGAYGDYSVAFLYPADLAQDESVYLLSSIGQLTYNEVYHNVSPFDCGVFNLSEDNIGKTITVELVIWQGNDQAHAIVLTTTSYKFGEVAHVLCVHDWNEPTYTWADDNSTVTATRVCKYDDTHIETETVETTAVTTAATCEENGQTVYTATFENEAFETQTKTVVIEATDHDWEFVNFTWTETSDGYTAVANYKCKNDESHTKTENATVKSEKTDATCEAAGQIVYTATEGDHTDTKTVEIEAIGHDWEFINFTWTETADGYTAVANYKCKNDESHTTTVDATVVKTEQAADLGVDGAIVYTATVTAEASADGEEHTDTKTIVIPGLPQAKVEDVTPVKEDVVLYSRDTLEPTGDVVDQLEAEFAFTALQVSEATYNYYKNWNCDYRVTFNADFAAESFGMYGEYSGWGKDFEVGFLYPNAVHMGDSIYLLNSVQPGLVQYKDVYDVIKTFYCGVFNLSEQNIGKSITVDLVIWQGDNTDDAIVITSTTYTFKGLSHIWEFVNFTWTETADGYTAVANYKCKADERHTATVDAAVTSVTTDATCEEAGKTVYTATVTADNSLDYAEHSDTKEVTIEAIGHDWGEVTYEWAADNSTVTATRVCKNDSTHVETETVNTTAAVTKPATCEAKGETTYTATFENEAFETQTKTLENVDALGHDWSEPTYEWAADNSTVTATRVCKNDSTHVETETVNTTSAVTTPATCETAGKTTYTATFTNTAFETQTKEVENVDALGHDWGEPTYEWAADNSTVTATRVCKNDATHKETETVNTTSEVTKQATATEKGEITYTAAFENEAFETQTKVVAIPSLPLAKVEETTPAKEDVALYTMPGMTPTGETLDKLGAEYLFTALEVEQDTYDYYKNWHCDYRIRFNDDISANTFGLYGAYTGFGNTYEIGFRYPANLAENESVYLLQSAGLDNVTYADIYDIIKTFDCGVFNLDDENVGKKITVELVIWEGDDADDAIVLTSTTYKFKELSHIWKFVDFTWTETADGWTAVANYVCTYDATHTTTLDAAVTSVTTDATCEEAGKTVYTATVTADNSLDYAEHSDTKEVTIEAIGHDWGEVTYEWAADNSTVTATRVCKNDSTHVETETVNTTAAVTKPATCEAKGETTYTATFTNEAFETQTKTLENVDALGHDWGEPTYEWAADNSTVTATRVCKNDSTHVETETVNTTETVITAATCEEKGESTYTATFENEAFEPQTKTVATDAIGHAYGEPTYTWSDDNKTCTGEMVCANDASHKITREVTATFGTVTPATCEETGEGMYVAIFVDPFRTQIKTVEIPAIGHDWAFVDFTWTETTDGYTAVANYVCNNDNTHTKQVDATVTKTQDSNYATYTATVTADVSPDGLERTEEKKVPLEPAFMTQALALEGQIGVYFYLRLPQVDGYEYEGVNFTISSTDGADAFVPFRSDLPTNGNGYYRFDYYVRSIEMADTITATLKYKLNGEEKTLVKTYSVKQYIEKFDNYTSLFSELEQTMTKATADYGHYVQAFLETTRTWTIGTDYAEMDKYYTDYTADDISAAQTGLADYVTAKTTGSNMEKITYTLVLDSDTELRVYFKPAASYTGTYTFTVNGETITEDGEKVSVKHLSDGRYMVSIRNIAAHELSKVYKVKAVGDGVESSMTVSALSYVNAMMTAYAGNEKAINAAVAIYRYAMAAKELKPGS